MATGPGVNQGKSKFVEEYLTTHGDARRSAINEAWRAAGHEGEISESLVSKLRAKHGLSGGRKGAEEPSGETAAGHENPGKRSSREEKPETASEDAPEVAVEEQVAGSAPSKSAFVEEVLRRDSMANIKAVNEAWSKAGHEGEISGPTFYKVKGRLTASGEATSSTTAEPKSSEATTAAVVKGKAPRTSAITTVTSKSSDPSGVVDEVEAGIDDLMYKLKGSGGMPEVEAALRAARRLLYRSQGE